MTNESFFSHPTLEGFNLEVDPSADRPDLIGRARQLIAERLGQPDEAWAVEAVGPGDPRHETSLDDSPEIDLVMTQPHLDTLLTEDRAVDVGAAWEASYALAELPGIIGAEPLWLLTQDDFADDPGPDGAAATLSDDAGGASDLRRLVPTTPSTEAARSRRGLGVSPTDPSWSPKMLQAPQAWAVDPPTSHGKSKGESIRVGHPDSGYRPHNELTFPGEPADRFLEQLGHDFIDGDRLENDQGGHGTGTASVLMSWDGPHSGLAPNILGVAPAAEIVPYRVTRKHLFVPSPVLFWSGARRLRDAIYLATGQGCHVISISLGWLESGSLHRAIQHAVANDVIIVAAAGNYVRKVIWPAAYPEVVAVAGCTHDRRRWSGSSRGRDVDITAPAADVHRAAFIGSVQGIATGSGTSFAAASVAGIAALWLAHHGREQLVDRYRGKRPLAEVFAEVLASTADPGPDGHDGKFGAGIANARRMLEAALPDPDAAPDTQGPAVRRRAAPATASATGLTAVEDALDISDRAGRVRLARSVGVRPQDLPVDLDGMGRELLFHVITDPERREIAFGADHLKLGEIEEGLVRTSEAKAASGATRTARASRSIPAPPPLSARLAARLDAPSGRGSSGGREPGRGRRSASRRDVAADMADREFVLVGADWDVGRAVDLLDRTGTVAAVIERPVDGETFFYLMHRRQFETIDPDLTVIDGLDLNESGATPTIDADAPMARAHEVDQPTVVVDEGSVVGFVLPAYEMAAAEPSSQPRRAPRRGTAPRTGAAANGGGDDDTVTRRLEAEAPDQATLGSEVPIVVSLSAEGSGAEVATEILGRVGDTVDVILSTQSGVELAGPQQVELAITADGTTAYAMFTVKAIATGQAKMQLLAFIDGRNVAVLPIRFRVEETPPDDPVQPRRTEADLQPPPYEDPDLTLLIVEQSLPGQGSTLQFWLTGDDPGLGLNFEPLGQVEFRADPDEYFAEYFGDVEELLPGTSLPATVVDQKVRAMGAKLYEKVVPPELQEKLWAIRDRVESILIQSTEPWVPWEMCLLSGPDNNGDIVEHGFLCEHYDISRWIQGEPLQVELSLDRVGLVVTGDSGLPSAQAEAGTVRALASPEIVVDDIPATYEDLYEALAGGTYTALHFTGHGLSLDGIDPSRSQIVLEGGVPFRAQSISGRARNLGKSNPLVVLNACQTGQGGMGLVGAGGWATALLKAGAGAFVGAHWSVLDESAARFSEVFYQRLVAGDTLAAAVRKARLEIRASGDPTWLAYVLYAACGVQTD